MAQHYPAPLATHHGVKTDDVDPNRSYRVRAPFHFDGDKRGLVLGWDDITGKIVHIVRISGLDAAVRIGCPGVDSSDYDAWIYLGRLEPLDADASIKV